jgi:hypothetical protein
VTNIQPSNDSFGNENKIRIERILKCRCVNGGWRKGSSVQTDVFDEKMMLRKG